MTKIAENLKCFWKKGGKKKIFFLFFLLLRLLLALVFALMLPVLFFVIFIFREPREIEPINKHLDDLVRSRSSVEEVSYSNAKISINKNFELVYSVENLSFRINEIHLKFPKINFRLKFVDIIRRKFFINEVEIIDLVGYFGYKDHENTDTKNTENENIKLSYTEFSDMVYVFLKYLHNNVLPFNSLKISNNIFYFSNKTTGTVDKLKLVEGDIKIDNRTNINFLFNLKSIINDKKEILRSSNDCVIFDDKKINCKITLNNLPFHDVVEVFKKTTHLKKYAEDINGNFDVRFDVFFEDYRNVKSSRFIITSSAGNFNLKNLFESRINYKNLNINGRTISHRGFILDNVKAKLFVGDNKTIDFSMLLDVKKNELVTMDFDIRNASFEKLYALWPVFLSQLGIRNWVIKHFKSGSITKAHANMDFKYSPKEHKYKLERIGSEVDFTNTYLDYEDTFPPMSKIDARAVFSIDDMKIHVNSAKIENTNITNADIYVNFNDKTPSLDIKAETKGNIYELFYFINNEKQNTIRDIVSNYMNGYARSKIYVDVPFLDNLGLSDVLIEVNSFVENNNTFLFRNNSNININVKKPVNSNTFGVDVNLREALINIKGSSFTKQKNEDLLLKLDIDVLDNRVLLKNIGTNNNAFLYAQADGIINITDKVDFNINFTDLNFVEKYNFKNISISGVYTDKIDQISLSVRNGYNLTGLLTNSKAKNEK
ncbi:MAG: hypothetical protein LBS34_00620, partial [Rickettsiales bacterium]|nr:hypothetical protein [Rickettsiales bacterium]